MCRSVIQSTVNQSENPQDSDQEQWSWAYFCDKFVAFSWLHLKLKYLQNIMLSVVMDMMLSSSSVKLLIQSQKELLTVFSENEIIVKFMILIEC